MSPASPFLKVRPVGLGGGDLARNVDNLGTAIQPLLGRLAQATDWIRFSEYLNGWLPESTTGVFTPASYRVDLNGFCHIRGLIDTGTPSYSLPCFRVPPALAPGYTHIYAIASNDLFGQARVDAQGYIYVTPPSSGTWASLDGIYWQVGE
jgi:hypothetical protein